MKGLKASSFYMLTLQLDLRTRENCRHPTMIDKVDLDDVLILSNFQNKYYLVVKVCTCVKHEFSKRYWSLRKLSSQVTALGINSKINAE